MWAFCNGNRKWIELSGFGSDTIYVSNVFGKNYFFVSVYVQKFAYCMR